MAIYFASDVHLGLQFKSQKREIIELRFVEWLRSIEHDCEKLFLVGDIFDFWFEWKRVVPKGFVRLLGQLATMSDNGIEINIFTGNHDMWLSGYFESELGAKVFYEPTVFELQGKKVFIGHGDNIGKRPFVARNLNRIFRSKSARWMFRKFIHPNTAMKFGNWWSSSNRHTRGSVAHNFMGEDEYLVKFARECEPTYDYFVFGHLHTPVIYTISGKLAVVVLGEWIVNPVYAKMENGEIKLEKFPNTSAGV